MATLKLWFRPSTVAGAEGTLYYQVTHKRCVRRISTGYHIFPHEWNTKTRCIEVACAGERRVYLQQAAWALRQRRLILARLERADEDFSLISEGMGHSSIKTTQTYLATIDMSRVNEAKRNIIRSISKGKRRER